MKQTKTYRQGDVLLVKIEDFPKGLTPKDRTLALGEITGHHHTLRAGQVFADATGQQYAQLSKETILDHQDHAQISIPKGKYKVVIQQEFDLIEGIRAVQD